MLNMRKFNGDQVMAEFWERTNSGPVNWEYIGHEFVLAYRLEFPDVSFEIRGAHSGKQVVYVLKMLDQNGETLGIAAGDSDEPEPPHYETLGRILRSARRQAGDPIMDDVPEAPVSP